MARKTMIALLLGALMLLVATPGSAVPDSSKEVLVVNEPTQPVPTAAQGTTQVGGTVSAIPGLHENLLTFDVTSPSFEYTDTVPYVALTSVTVTNLGDDVLSFHMNGSYEAGACRVGTGPALRVQVQPRTTSHIDLPIPLLFQRETVDCGPAPVPVTKNGFFISSHSSSAVFQSVLLIGYQG